MEQNTNINFDRVRSVLIVILVLNWVVAAAKVIVGIMTRVESMTADGVHSLSDGMSNIIGLIGVAVSMRPVDRSHPYGHKKYETFFSLGIAALLLIVMINLVKEGFSHIFHPLVPEVNVISFVVMVVTMVINYLVMRYEYRVGNELGSDILVADSMHTRADMYTSISVVVALVGIKMGFPILDPIATFVISIFIGYAAFEIIRDASRILCDTAVIVDPGKIASIVMTVKGVKACHKIRSRGRPDDVCLDLHVQVDAAMNIGDAHSVSFDVESMLKKAMPHISDVLVHIEPLKKRKHKK